MNLKLVYSVTAVNYRCKMFNGDGQALAANEGSRRLCCGGHYMYAVSCSVHALLQL